MHITQREESGRNILTLSGRFDFKARHVFQTAINQAKSKQNRHLILNLLNVEFIDSAAVGLLMLTKKDMTRSGTSLALVVHGGYVLQVLQLMKIGELIAICSTEQEAVAGSGFRPESQVAQS